MNSNEKRWIVLLIAVVIIAVVLIVALVNSNGRNEEPAQVDQSTTQEQTQNEVVEQYVTQMEDGTKVNTSDQFNTDRTYNNLQISNIQFTERDGVTVLLADVKNTGSAAHEAEVVKITLLDENGETVTDFNAVIADLEPGETGKINASITADVANARDFRIETTTQE